MRLLCTKYEHYKRVLFKFFGRNKLVRIISVVMFVVVDVLMMKCFFWHIANRECWQFNFFGDEHFFLRMTSVCKNIQNICIQWCVARCKLMLIQRQHIAVYKLLSFWALCLYGSTLTNRLDSFSNKKFFHMLILGNVLYRSCIHFIYGKPAFWRIVKSKSDECTSDKSHFWQIKGFMYQTYRWSVNRHSVNQASTWARRYEQIQANQQLRPALV